MGRIAHRRRYRVLVVPFDIVSRLLIAIGHTKLDRSGFGCGRDWIVIALMWPSSRVWIFSFASPVRGFASLPMRILFFRSPAWCLLLNGRFPPNDSLSMSYRLSITPVVSFVIIRCICRCLLRILAMTLRISVVLMILLSHRHFLIVFRRHVRSRTTVPS